LLLTVSTAFGESKPATAKDYTTCAVYHRMVVGSFMQRDGNMQIMVDLEREKMDALIAKAKSAGIKEHGEDAAEDIFLKAWRSTLADMTDRINRNYENISQLKYTYKERCDELLK